MRKPVGRPRGLRAKESGSTQDRRRLLDRILDTPHLARVVPHLQPEVLHRIIQSCGLEDCGEIVALTTPDQLARVFDLDLWRPARPGSDEEFDAERFGLWLEVMMEAGAAAAARTLADVDVDLATAAFAQHVRVFDPATLSPAETADGDEMPAGDTPSDHLSCELGGYLVVARETDSWDAVVAVLSALDAEHQAYFHRVMRGCRDLTNSGFEIDGLDDLLTHTEQTMFDLAFDREQRREQHGYVTAPQARAFLQMSRQLPLGHDATPPGNPVARAYFRAVEWTPADADSGSHRLPEASGAAPAADDSAEAAAAIVGVLVDAGILPQQPRGLLEGPKGHAPRLARIQTQMQLAADRDHAAFSMRSQELAFLANTIVAGCPIQARPFTAQEASDAAVATCNLGLENWPARWLSADPRGGSSVSLPDDFLVAHDLIGVFQVGWTVLHDDVCMDTAERLLGVLAHLECGDRETQAGLTALRIAMTKHWRAGAPWRARHALDVITILDMPAWATLLGLMDECPVIHAGMAVSQGSHTREISATAFEFISENSQIASVHEFMRLLPETLRG
ncbi:MAG TPA: DUF6178 family protein [Vicinamibacterales bacterium]|nr:DUF6178 family protein [Vicinamibacterales bacterium]